MPLLIAAQLRRTALRLVNGLRAGFRLRRVPDAPNGVLVVDDDPELRLHVAEMLEQAGLSAFAAANGADALDLLRRRRPAVILLDIHMPVMNGWQFLERYRALDHQRAPVIVWSSGSHYRERALAAGASAFLTKPMDPDQLVRAVRAVLVSGPEPPRSRP